MNKYFIKDNLDKGLVVTTYVLIGLQLAYIITKGHLKISRSCW